MFQMPHIQWVGKGRQKVARFLRRVPKDCLAKYGAEWFFAPLDTHDPKEANRLVTKHIDRTNEIIRAIRANEWPPIPRGDLNGVTARFWKWATIYHWTPSRISQDGNLEEIVSRFLRRTRVEDADDPQPGSEIQPGSGHHRRLLELLQEQIAASLPAEPKPRVATLAVVPVASGAAPTLMPDAKRICSELVEVYIEREGVTRKKSADDYRRTFRRFEEVNGKLSVAMVTDLEVEKFYQAIASMKSDRRDKTAVKHNTINRQMSNVRKFFRWAKARKLTQVNPAAEIRVEKRGEADSEGWSPYSTAELNLICRALHDQAEHRRWFALVGLFSGMRLSEIAQLERTDLIDLNERKHFAVTRTSAFDNAKSLKNKSARRQVPVHPELIRLGFLRWVEKNKRTDGKLFPSERYSRWWNDEFTPALGIKANDKVFHSLRNNFRDALTAATEDREARDRIFGHHPDGTGAANYGSRDLRPHVSAVIDRIRFDGLRL